MRSQEETDIIKVPIIPRKVRLPKKITYEIPKRNRAFIREHIAKNGITVERFINEAIETKINFICMEVYRRVLSEK